MPTMKIKVFLYCVIVLMVLSPATVFLGVGILLIPDNYILPWFIICCLYTCSWFAVRNKFNAIDRKAMAMYNGEYIE